MHLIRTQKQLGAVLRAARLAARLDQEQVEAATHVSQTHLSKIETGDSLPKPETALKIARAVGADLDLVLRLMARARMYKSAERQPIDRDAFLSAAGDVLMDWGASPEEVRQLLRRLQSLSGPSDTQ